MTVIARPLPAAPPAEGSPAFAALLSTLLPGLGQLYQARWLRGALMVLLPVLALSLVAVFAPVADVVAAAIVRRATLFAILVVGGLFAYHVAIVADAFAGRLGQSGLRGRHVIDYAVLLALVLGLVLLYVSVYRQSAAWASVLTAVFEPATRTVTTPAGVPQAPESPAPGWSGRDRLNVLLLGIDSREGDETTQNTDTLIVVSIDPLNRSAAMLSIPRDTLVDIPGVGKDKVNAAYVYGGRQRGADLARRTIEGLLGITINSYALVDFQAFRETVDALGGVLVDVRRPLRDESFPTVDFGIERIRFLAGPQLQSGDDALRYARSRHDANDFARVRRQQQVLAAVRVRLAQVGLFRIPAIVERVGPAIRTNFDPGGILPLARTGLGIEGSDIRSEVLLPCGSDAPHCELTEQNSPLGYYLIPDRAKVRDLVAEVFYDPRVRQEAAAVEVRSAGARSDTVRDVADKLSARQFNVVRVTDGDRGRSAVLVRDQRKRYTAEQLAKQLGLPIETATGEGAEADIVVRIGLDFRGVSSGP